MVFPHRVEHVGPPLPAPHIRTPVNGSTTGGNCRPTDGESPPLLGVNTTAAAAAVNTSETPGTPLSAGPAMAGSSNTKSPLAAMLTPGADHLNPDPALPDSRSTP